MTDTPYQSPKTEPATKSGSVVMLGRISLFGFLFLSIVTFGLYNLYWLISRSMSMNRIQPHPINPAWIWSFVVALLLSAGYDIYFLALQSLPLIQILESTFIGQLIEIHKTQPLSLAIDFTYYLLFYILLIKFHIRLRRLAQDDPEEIANFNYLWTLLLGTLYFQYKINACIDHNADVLRSKDIEFNL